MSLAYASQILTRKFGAYQKPSSSGGDPLVQNLLAYYSFDGNVLDITNQGNDLINSDTWHSKTCTFSSSVKIKNQSASNSYNTTSSQKRGRFVSSTTFLDITQPSTIAGWFYFAKNTNGSGGENYAMAGDSLAGQGLPTIAWLNSGYTDYLLNSFTRDTIVAYSPQSDAGTFGTYTTISVTALTWYFVVSRFDPLNNKIELIVNAGTPTSASTSGTFTNLGNPFGIFDGPNLAKMPSHFTNGKNEFVDELGVWQRLLTDAEVASLYNGGTGKFYNPSTNSFQ